MQCSMKPTKFPVNFALLAFLMAFWSACNNGRKEGSDSENAKIETAVNELFHDSIVKLANYSYYVPRSLVDRNEYATVVFFDPQGDGNQPLSRYSAIADSLGIALIGSSVSKNGLSMQIISQHYKDLIESIRQNLPNRARSIILAGFSGGAKVATQIALSDPAVIGVVSTGAMLDPQERRPDMPIALVAGKGDLNHQSMLMSWLQLMQKNRQVLFQQFNGRHEWCPEQLMQTCLGWVLQKNGFTNEHQRLKAFRNDEFQLLGQSGLDEFICLQALQTCYGDQPEMKAYKLRLQDLANSGLLQKELSFFYERFDKEEMIKQQYVTQLQSVDLVWWKKEIDRLERLSDGISEEAFQAQRLLGFIGLFCYMSADRMLDQPGSDPTGIIDVYLLAEPDNPEAQRMKDQVSTRPGT